MELHRHHHSVWSASYFDLRDSEWNAEDAGDSERRKALIEAYRSLWYDEYAVFAVLRFAVEVFGSNFSAEEFSTLPANLLAYYRSFDTPAQEFLDERYGGLPLEWLSPSGVKELEEQVYLTSEFWVDDYDIPGIYVFQRP